MIVRDIGENAHIKPHSGKALHFLALTGTLHHEISASAVCGTPHHIVGIDGFRGGHVHFLFESPVKAAVGGNVSGPSAGMHFKDLLQKMDRCGLSVGPGNGSRDQFLLSFISIANRSANIIHIVGSWLRESLL